MIKELPEHKLIIIWKAEDKSNWAVKVNYVDDASTVHSFFHLLNSMHILISFPMRNINKTRLSKHDICVNKTTINSASLISATMKVETNDVMLNGAFCKVDVGYIHTHTFMGVINCFSAIMQVVSECFWGKEIMPKKEKAISCELLPNSNRYLPFTH